MPLRHEPEVSHGDWITGDDWLRLCSLGPPVFDGYVRLHHPGAGSDLDPQELLDVAGDLDEETLTELVGVLARHTSTPDDCFFALWDGFGEIGGSPATQLIALDATGDAPYAVPPAFPAEVLAGPRLELPARTYLMFRGPLAEAGDWGAADRDPGWRRRINSPNLIWPADHAWFVASEIDLPWTGIGGSPELMRDLLDDPALTVEPVTRSV